MQSKSASRAGAIYGQKKTALLDGLTIPLGVGMLKIERHCRQTVSLNKLRDQEMTAYFVRVGRSFRVYGQYIKHECRVYNKPKQLFHNRYHPIRKGVADRLLSAGSD